MVDTSNDLGASSEEVSVTITNFADNSQSQAASSEEITATMEEISAGVDNGSLRQHPYTCENKEKGNKYFVHY